MKTLLTSLIAVVLCIHTNAQQISPIADSNNFFAFKLYNQIKKDKKENLFFSPFSISTALAMTYAGARNETAKQMAATMHFNADQDVFSRDYQTYLGKIESDTGKDLILGIANSLWLGKSLELLPPFKETVITDYNSEAKNVDFSKSEKVRQEINTWVAQKTKDKIQDLILPGMLSASTRLVLVNAIYFKGRWKVPFSKDSTKSDDFYKSGATTVKAKFMHNTNHFRYYEDRSLQAVEIPYEGNKTSMLVILPNEINGIDGLENQLDYSYYTKIASSIHPRKVILAVPKFKTTVQFELAGALSAMGMPNAFSGSADFGGISKEGLMIGAVIHKAFIDVNEEGTEAAAATAVLMPMSVAVHPPKNPVFIANHPFIFVIRDNATGSILFMGKIMDPTKE
jgi:serpin B